MAVGTAYVESAQALGANEPIAVVVAGTYTVRLRRMIIGVRTVDTSPVDQLLTVAFSQELTQGTPTETTSFAPVDAFAPRPDASVEYAWSTDPTFPNGGNRYGVPLTTHDPVDIRWGRDEAVVIYAANHWVLWNVGNALPAGHLYTVTLEVEQ